MVGQTINYRHFGNWGSEVVKPSNEIVMYNHLKYFTLDRYCYITFETDKYNENTFLIIRW